MTTKLATYREPAGHAEIEVVERPLALEERIEADVQRLCPRLGEPPDDVVGRFAHRSLNEARSRSIEKYVRARVAIAELDRAWWLGRLWERLWSFGVGPRNTVREIEREWAASAEVEAREAMIKRTIEKLTK